MIDIKKKYKTRDGHKVRIYSTDGGGEYPVHGAYFEGGEWNVDTWHYSGKYHEEGDTIYDLIEIDEKEELLEEARKRYPKGTKFIGITNGIISTVKGELTIGVFGSIVDSVNGHLINYNGKWAEIVKEHETLVSVFKSNVNNEYYATTGTLSVLHDHTLVAKKTITFYEGEGLN